MDDNLQKIQELESKNQELTKKLEELSNTFKEIKTTLELHTHTGRDGSTKFFNSDIELKSGTGISVGKYGFIDADVINDKGRTLLGATVLGDLVGASGVVEDIQNSSQIAIEHRVFSNGVTNDSYFYGIRSPIYSSTNGGGITSGGTTFAQSKYSWTTNELDGAFIAVFDTANTGQFDWFEIASNTTTTLTITGGTWTFTDTNAQWFIIVPVYLGWSTFPWRRAYVLDGTGGGVRFGGGDTAGGQNGLLYMDAAGDLYWRPKTGAAVKLN